MNPSVDAKERAAVAWQFMSLDELGTFARENILYPKDGAAIRMDGSEIQHILRLTTFAAVEERINKVFVAVSEAPNRKEKTAKLSQAIETAKTATSAQELNYLACMFINHREVMRSLSRNSAIDERTQLMLANDADLSRDKDVRLGLAHNPALTVAAAVLMLHTNSDLHIENGLALTAARKSRSGVDAEGFASVCKALTGSADSVIRAIAITGVRDPEVLRQIANNNSVILASRELGAVAGNRNTPDDVLADLTKRSFPGVQPFLSISVAAIARNTLANKQYNPENYSL